MSARVEKRLAIVGAPRAVDPYLDALRDFPELVLDAVVEPDPNRVVRPELRRAQRFDDVGDMIHDRAVPDVALLATPPGDHFDEAQALLRAGADLLVLAPLATRSVEAEGLIELAERAGRELTTAIPARVSPAIQSARRTVTGGSIGRLCYLEVSLSEKRDPRASWRGDPARSGGGVWMQLGAEALDIAELLGGPVQRLRMLDQRERQGAGVEDEVCVECDHGDGLVSRLCLSWNGERSDPIARLFGDGGELLIGRTQAVVRSQDEHRVCGPGYDRREACRALLAEHLRRRCSLYPPVDTGPATVGWIEAAYHSLRDQRWQP